MTTLLTYHHIGDVAPDSPSRNLYVPPDQFRAQLAWLRSKGFQGVSLRHVREELLKQAIHGGRAVAITFDDGTADVYQNAFPILREFDFTATVFVITDTLEQTQEQETQDHLTREQILEMAHEGISFGSHSCSHKRLTELSNRQALNEICNSKKALEELLQRPCDWFCYPYGNFSLEIIEMIKHAGYLGAVSAMRDNRNRPKYLFYLNRVMVMHDTSPTRFKYYFSRLYHLRHFLKNKERWGQYV
jgi:peptidoglycan/xylan/chitin deacetylase (PgdA/CDA1 family)